MNACFFLYTSYKGSVAIVDKDQPRIYLTLQWAEPKNGKLERGETRSMTITEVSLHEAYEAVRKLFSEPLEKKKK